MRAEDFLCEAGESPPQAGDSPGNEVKKHFLSVIERTMKNIEPEYSISVCLGSPSTLFDIRKSSESRKQEKKYTTQLNTSYNFDNFVEGNSNIIALSASKGVSVSPDGQFNPLLIYGSTGLGKSHLMHAIGNEIKNN